MTPVETLAARARIVEQFITYDIETTNAGILKGLDKQGKNEQNGTQFVI